MRPDTDVAVVSSGQRLTHRDLREDRLGLRERVPAGGTVRLETRDAALVAAAFTTLDGWAGEVRLVPSDTAAAAIDDALRVVGGDAPARPAETGADGAGSEPGTRFTLYTSGTTGAPKPVEHTSYSLSRTIHAGRRAGTRTWGLLYDPVRMAGVQVILTALRGGDKLVAPALDLPLAARVQMLVEEGVDALSATPTNWRQILQVPQAAEWPLQQVTLGGEIADQRTLTSLTKRYPAARVTHVFASTETGAAFAVHDGREGFPVSYLTEPPNDVRIQVRDEILHVERKVAGSAEPVFVSTGDVVEVVGDRVLFRGRSSGAVNVGGETVWPERVEELLREHPEVLEAAVSSAPSAITSNVLVAMVSLRDDAEVSTAPARLRKWVRERAPRTHVPAVVRVVDAIGVSTAGKVLR